MEGTTWREPPSTEVCAAWSPSCQPLRGRPAAALTRDKPAIQAAVCWVGPAAPEGGFEVASDPRRSRDLLAHLARLGVAVTEGEPRSG